MIVPPELRMGASATVAVLVAKAVGPAASVIATEIVYEPSSIYVWLPVTEKKPGPSGTMMPVSSAVPSPQSIVAVKSPARALVFSSVKVATWPLKVGGAESIGNEVAPSVVLTSTLVALNAPSDTEVLTMATLLGWSASNVVDSTWAVFLMTSPSAVTPSTGTTRVKAMKRFAGRVPPIGGQS